MLLCTQSNTRRTAMATAEHDLNENDLKENDLKEHDLKMKLTERFSDILKSHGLEQEFFARGRGGPLASSAISEYAKKRRGMSIDNFVVLLRHAKFNNKFIRDHITDILKAYYAEVIQDLDLIRSPRK